MAEDIKKIQEDLAKELAEIRAIKANLLKVPKAIDPEAKKAEKKAYFAKLAEKNKNKTKCVRVCKKCKKHFAYLEDHRAHKCGGK